MKYLSFILFGIWVVAEMLSAQEMAASGESLGEVANGGTTEAARLIPARDDHARQLPPAFGNGPKNITAGGQLDSSGRARFCGRAGG